MNKDDRDLQDLMAKLEYITRKQEEKEMDLVTEYNGELHTGDLILIAENNYANIGFYLGRGQGGSMQYFLVTQLTRWLAHRDDPNYNTKKGGPAKCYMNSPHSNRVSKYSPELLTQEWRLEYELALEALKFLKVIR